MFIVCLSCHSLHTAILLVIWFPLCWIHSEQQCRTAWIDFTKCLFRSLCTTCAPGVCGAYLAYGGVGDDEASCDIIYGDFQPHFLIPRGLICLDNRERGVVAPVVERTPLTLIGCDEEIIDCYPVFNEYLPLLVMTCHIMISTEWDFMY